MAFICFVNSLTWLRAVLGSLPAFIVDSLPVYSMNNRFSMLDIEYLLLFTSWHAMQELFINM